jgi:hypothetical protein
MFFLSPSAMAWSPTDRARAFAADVKEALRISGIGQKEAALTMDIPESLLSEWLSGQKQISGSRLAELPESFHDELRDLQADRAGEVVLRRDLVTLLRGAAALPKRMLRAHAVASLKERRRA